ncbi:hypothetical protein CHELA40_13808 [Chelatococcus asaccharovorans]|nr:hypothetical protein CHELA40_13808 [Chelatococcus asaccharovorans]CAH1675487.1 hypothetical protein CHELA17_61818 [Chelatococcus asaccharovorans]
MTDRLAMRLHAFLHRFAVDDHTSGGGISILQQCLGHSSLALAQMHHANLTPQAVLASPALAASGQTGEQSKHKHATFRAVL